MLECRKRGFYKLHAFVVMPDRFHVLLTPGDEATLEKAMQMIKGGSAHKMGKCGNPATTIAGSVMQKNMRLASDTSS